eukprot:SAG31_NODE_276_length_18650_cov_5.821842_12_plen_54_part_00
MWTQVRQFECGLGQSFPCVHRSARGVWNVLILIWRLSLMWLEVELEHLSPIVK